MFHHFLSKQKNASFFVDKQTRKQYLPFFTNLVEIIFSFKIECIMKWPDKHASLTPLRMYRARAMTNHSRALFLHRP